MFFRKLSSLFNLTCLSFLSFQTSAVEYPIGEPEQRHGMGIAAVYLQPIRMAPKSMMTLSEQADIHLEVDIRALDMNPNGFAKGDWIPYLYVKYEIKKQGTDEVISGDFMPMVANDGPHYGDNVKLKGPGKYTLKYIIFPPNAPDNQAGKHFGRHTDRLTGVRPWFKTFELNYEFIYAGIGKRGGY